MSNGKMQELFEQALNIREPWYVKRIEFIQGQKRLNIEIDFKKGTKF